MEHVVICYKGEYVVFLHVLRDVAVAQQALAVLTQLQRLAYVSRAVH
jgi:hypothetical protein